MSAIKELEKILKTEVLIHIEKNILSEEDAVKILQDLEDMSDDEDDI